MVAVTAGASREVIRVTGTGLEVQAARLAPAGFPRTAKPGATACSHAAYMFL
jgi:hypothetical protein